MADLSQLETALINADKAGDTEAAKILAAEISRQRGMTPAKPQQTQPSQPAPSTLEKIGRGIKDPIDGGAQLLEKILPQGVVNAGNRFNNWLANKTGIVDRVPEGGVDQMVRDDERAYQDRRKAGGESGFDGYRLVGNIASPVNIAAVSRIPGAVTSIGGGALSGLASGLLSPVVEGDNFWSEKAKQGGTGAAFGTVVPAAARTAKVLKAGLVDPFTEAGRTRIVGSAIRNAAADPAKVAANLATRTGSTPGFMPTAGQASGDAGVASLERAARAIDPGGFGAADTAQRSSLISALRSVAKTPEDRAAAVEAVDKQARSLYGEAFKESVEVTPTLTRLAGRPSMRKAEARARSLADEMGMPFQARLDDMQPRTIPLPARNAPDSVVIQPAEKFNAYTNPAPRGPSEITIPGERLPESGFELPPVESVPVRDMHTLKMGMDALLADPTQGIAGREAAAIKRTRNQLLDQLPESYQAARLNHIEMNKPVNQMDIGQELYNRFVPALADGADVPFRARAEQLANALRNGDKLAKRVVGLKNAKMEDIMTPEQMATLRGVVSDAQMKAAAEDIGRGVGSDTVQKMAMTNLIRESGIPTWMSGFAPLRPAGGILKTAGDILYTKNDETMRHLLADVLKDPARAAEAMERAGVPPSKYAEILRAASQAAALGTVQAANAPGN